MSHEKLYKKAAHQAVMPLSAGYYSDSRADGEVVLLGRALAEILECTVFRVNSDRLPALSAESSLEDPREFFALGGIRCRHRISGEKKGIIIL